MRSLERNFYTIFQRHFKTVSVIRCPLRFLPRQSRSTDSLSPDSRNPPKLSVERSNFFTAKSRTPIPADRTFAKVISCAFPQERADLLNLGCWGALLTFPRLGEEFEGLKSWAWLPKFCRIFGVLQNLSSTSFILCETFCSTFLQNPKGSAEFWGTFGSPGPSLEDQLFFLP